MYWMKCYYKKVIFFFFKIILWFWLIFLNFVYKRYVFNYIYFEDFYKMIKILYSYDYKDEIYIY